MSRVAPLRTFVRVVLILFYYGFSLNIDLVSPAPPKALNIDLLPLDLVALKALNIDLVTLDLVARR